MDQLWWQLSPPEIKNIAARDDDESILIVSQTWAKRIPSRSQANIVNNLGVLLRRTKWGVVEAQRNWQPP